MDSTSRNAQGYSDFFTSGLRAMVTGRSDRRRTKAKSVDLSQSAHNRSSFWTDEYFELEQSNKPFSGRRRASAIIGGTMLKDYGDGAHISSGSTKKRRSGLSSFSARWFSRAKEPVSIPPATHDEDDHALYADDEKEQSSLSIESPSLPSLHERSPPLHPFSSWSDDGRTTFEPPSDLSTFKVGRKRESFLSLNSSSSNLSSIIFPAVPWSNPTFTETEYHHPLILPPYTQLSSSSSWDREGGEESERRVEEGEEEEETPIETSYTSEDQEICDWDAPARIDWRQFHVHLLQIANDGSKL